MIRVLTGTDMNQVIRMLLITLIPTVFAGNSLAAEFSSKRIDGTTLTYYLDTPESKQYPVVILVQGSECSTAFQKHEWTKGVFLNQEFAVLTVEKRGLNKDSQICPDEYLANNSIYDRVLDYLQITGELRRTLPNWNNKIVWASGSEGAVVTVIATPLIPESHLLILLGLGGGMTMADDMLLLTKKQMEEIGANREAIDKALKDMQDQFRLIHGDPTPWKEWLSEGKTARNTYKWWSAILAVRPLTILEQINIPIFFGHGTLDKSVPVESADIVERRFKELGKQNLSYFRYNGLDHSWTDQAGQPQLDRVMADILGWIQSNY
jgi:pimeloyl-ACP methyl ester carboxylesterase